MRLSTLLSIATLASGASLHAQGSSSRAERATVRGVVRDSIDHAVLAGAVVQLVIDSAGTVRGRTATTDSSGQFTIRDVPEGRHTIGFLHPMLDSLGIEPPQRSITVGRSQEVRADLAIPGPAQLRASICARTGIITGTLVLGFVRDARTRAPLAGADVTAEWLEIVFGGGKPVRRVPRNVANTAANGWFAICNMPSDGSIRMVANHGTDSSDVIEVPMSAEGVVHRDLYVGASRVSASSDTTRANGPSRKLRLGDGRLTGKVVATLDGRPLAGAQVAIADGPQTRTNERGEWSLSDVPYGTRLLEVRAVGYYPTRQPVDVIADAPPLRLAMPTLKAMLDTVRITAARLADRYQSGFESRRQTGQGRYLSADQIARHNPVNVAQVLRMLPGVRVDRDSDGFENKILLRASVDDWCYPAVYINGHYMRDLDTDDLDAWVRPSDIMGIEVYAGISAPVQFQQGMTGCGSILIWRK